MYLDPERALEAFMLLCLDVDAAQRSVVASEIPDERDQRREVILFGRRVADQHDPLARVWLPIHPGDRGLDGAQRILFPLIAALCRDRTQKGLHPGRRERERLRIDRLALTAEHDDPNARYRYQL